MLNFVAYTKYVCFEHEDDLKNGQQFEDIVQLWAVIDHSKGGNVQLVKISP